MFSLILHAFMKITCHNRLPRLFLILGKTLHHVYMYVTLVKPCTIHISDSILTYIIKYSWPKTPLSPLFYTYMYMYIL